MHNPGGAWRAQTDAVQALLDDADTAEREHDFPHIGRMLLGQAIDMIYTSDVFLHRWDQWFPVIRPEDEQHI